MTTRLINVIALVLLILASWVTTSSAQHKMRMGMSPATLTFPEGKDVIEIPFELVREKILIPIRVNGSEPMRFVLDTGAPMSVLMSSELGKTLDLDIMGEAQVGGVGEGKAQTVPIAGGVHFELGGIEITGATMAVGVAEEIFPDLGWQGVIGRPVFANSVVDFDFSNKILRLYRPDKFEYSGEGSVLPLTLAYGSFPYVETEVSIDGGAPIPATMVIDTGAGHALSLSVENHDDLDPPEKTISGVLGWGASGVVRGSTGRVTSLKLGDYVLNDVVSGFPNPSDMHMLAAGGGMGQITRHGLIGAKILKRFRVVFDYTNKRVIFEPNGAFDTPFTFNTTGLIIAPWTPGTASIEVAFVIASSPAQDAGIEVGDYLIAIDGKPISAITVNQIDDFLEQGPGTKMTVTIRREAKEFEKELVLRELI